MRLYHVAATTVFATLLCQVSAQCTDGQVRLVGGCGPHEGRVELCWDHQWGTVCDDRWGVEDARVVCRQLGYTPEGAQGLGRAYFGQGNGSILLDEVRCNPSIHRTLLQCSHRPLNDHNCRHYEDAGVRCVPEQILVVKSVSVANITTHNYTILHTVLINVTLINSTTNLFQVGCYNQHHGVFVNNSLSGETNSFTAFLSGLIPSSFYTCCTSAIYHQHYVSRGTCTDIKTPGLLTINENSGLTITESSGIFTISLSSTFNPRPVDSMISNQAESKTTTSVSLVGGILGFIIAVLLVLLLLLVIASVCLLQPNLRECVISKTRRSNILKLSRNKSSNLPLEQNLSYTTSPSSLTTSGTSDMQNDDYSHLQY